MGDLLKEIQLMFPKAAEALTKAGFVTDSDIRSLTREDLNELLPGSGDFDLRKDVFEMIQKSSPPNMPQKEVGELQNKLASCAVMGDLLKEIYLMFPKAADVLTKAGLITDSDIRSLTREDLNELLPGAGDFRLRKNVFETIQKSSQLTSSEIPPNDNVDPLKNNNTRQPDSKDDEGAVMGDLWKEIHIKFQKAADALKQAGFETDSDIRSLTREDLNELLPGVEDLRLRKDVYNMIHIPRPANMLLKELGELRNNLASSAQIDSGVSMDHIRFITEQLVIVQVLLNDNVDLLKKINTWQPDSKADKGAVMGDLLKEIHLMFPKAADVLKQAGLETDSDIRSLTRLDLYELLPGVEDFKLRKDVFETIQKSSQLTSSETPPNDNVDPLKNNNTRQPDSKADEGAVMGDLRKEIQRMSEEAAAVLKKAGFVTDSDIRSLTREDLNELLPKTGDFKLRKNVFQTIQKSSQLTSSETPPNDNVDPLKNNNTRQPDSKADEGAVMGDLRKEIQRMSEEAAAVLKKAGFVTDSDIRSLTREDLNELLPKTGDFKLRKNVFQTIQKSSQLTSSETPPNDNVDPLKNNNTRQPDSKADEGAVMGDLLKEIQRMSEEAAAVLKTAQIDPEVIMEKTRLIIDILLNMQDDSKADKDWVTLEEPQKSPSPAMVSSSYLDGSQDASRSKRKCNASRDSNARTSGHNSQEVTVNYKMVVGGQTFGAHKQLMDQVNQATKCDVRLLENSQDSQIIIVFCPITSRVESDVKAVMSGVPGDNPVILVKMHHVCEPKSSLCLNTSIDDRNNVLQVNVFYHETFPGLLKCELNDTAVSQIQHELLKYSDHRSKDTSQITSNERFVENPVGWFQQKYCQAKNLK
ncbi:uncharacterized protein LOC133024025 isoform X2 [Limanda limanda]|uniref:uncharacterized protein LOC133024025 isoform X2 n=1 Tax=Limanda limanda TaxID=27771 RepID=UPI0029C997AB|nr:uncharacterized protein LOC133024025 isoform X2 [Limanda limanda]